MPTLLEIERAVYRSLVEHDDEAATQHIAVDGLAPEARLNVYRNTFISTLTTALRLSFPAVHRLVGAEFFESVARIFIEAAPPRSAYLGEYGADVPEFLKSFPPAASLAYLSGAARLEWAVSRALHAPDADALDVSRLSTIDPGDHRRIVFVPHPSVGLVQADHPVDEIWRAVLAQDDAAMTVIDLAAGPVWLLVQRLETGVDVRRLNEPAWQFMVALCAGRPLQDAIDAAPEVNVPMALAGHLAAGRFVCFDFVNQGNTAQRRERSP
jgi:hypothetical protein